MCLIMFGKKTNPALLNTLQMECIIEALYRTLTTHIPRELTPAFCFTLSGINFFCSGCVTTRRRLTEELTKGLLASSCFLTTENFFGKTDMKFHDMITDRLTEYLFSDWKKDESSLSYLIRFLNAGGIIYMLYMYKNSSSKDKQLLRTREDVLNILNNGGSITEALKCLPEGLSSLVSTFSKLAFNEYRLVANNKKLNELFPAYEKFR